VPPPKKMAAVNTGF